MEFIEIVVIELPSHTSNWTQLLDRSFFKSLKSGSNKEVDTFINSAGVAVGHAQFLKIFERCASLKKIHVVSGFKATGTFPLDAQAIPEEAYIPSTLYVDEHDTTTDDSVDTTAVKPLSQLAHEQKRPNIRATELKN